jgi:hypothetical protein
MMAAGCSEEDGGGPVLPPPLPPSISFESPTDGATIDATTPTVEVIAQLEVKNLPLGGSVACRLDGTDATTLNSDDECRYSDVGVGEHELSAHMLDGAGAELSASGASASIDIKITLDGDSCEDASDCSDDDECTLEQCEAGACVTYANFSDHCNPGEDADKFICKDNEDCAVFSEESSACFASFCHGTAGACAVGPLADGSPCDDGDSCTATDICQSGACAGGAADCSIEDACSECPDACGPCEETGTETGGPNCGDGTCDPNEDCTNCSSDCGECPPGCGDNSCDAGAGETCNNCPGDCGACPEFCGDGECSLAETCGSCPTDCGECPCGNGVCGEDETCETCPWDCGACATCGDGVCDPDYEECDVCKEDCGFCQPTCGDSSCNGTESCFDCPADCGVCPFCGDGTCDENESCLTCSGDCGECPCDFPGGALPPLPPNAVCGLHGCSGDSVDCILSMARSGADTGTPESALIPVSVGFKLNYDTNRVALIDFVDEVCIDGIDCFEACMLAEGCTATNGTGHSLTTKTLAEWNASGSGGVLMYHLGDPTTPLTEAHFDEGGEVVGDAAFLTVRFQILQDLPKQSAEFPWMTTTPGKLQATSGTLTSLQVILSNGIIVTSED